MAFTLTDTTYAGEAASGFIVKSLLGCETVAGGHIYVKDGIRKSFTIPRMDVTGIIQDRVATPTTAGTVTITGRALNPADYMIYNEFNPRDMEDHWIAAQLSPNLVDRRLPFSAEATITERHLTIGAAWLDALIWRGDTSANSSTKLHYFDGIVKKLTTAAVNVVASPVALTAGNIVAKLDAMVALLTSSAPALLYDPSMKFFMNKATAALYAQAQKNQTTKGVDFTQQGQWQYDGYPIVKIAAIPNNCIVFAKGLANETSNLWLGVDSGLAVDGQNSDTNVKVSPLQANSELWFIEALMKADVQFGWAEECVLYAA